MEKRMIDMVEDQHERMKRMARERQRRLRGRMTDEERAQLRAKNNKWKRESRQRRRDARAAQCLNRTAMAPGPSNDVRMDSIFPPPNPVSSAQPSDAAGPSRVRTPSTHSANASETAPVQLPPFGGSDLHLGDAFGGLHRCSPPMATSPQSSCQRPCNLVTNILGTQVDSAAQIVEWSSGQRTVLPYLQDPLKASPCNLLARDQIYVEDLARQPPSRPSSGLILHLDGKGKKTEVLDAAREALSNNKSVVLRDFVDTDSFEFTMRGMVEHFATIPERPIIVHDMGARTKDFGNPYVETTVKEFIEDISNHKVVRMALNYPLPQFKPPSPFEKLDDGLCWGWAQTQHRLPVNEKLIPGDVWTVTSWGVAHHAAVLTYPHHDAEGTCTFAAPLSGVKNWVIILVKNSSVTRENLAELLADLATSEEPLSKFADKVDAETLHLYPGDIIFMPPGQIHAVYTPVASFYRGGHFFNLDTMHLTELSRYVDTTKGRSVTNESRRGTLETLCRLVIILPLVPKSRKLYKRSLVSLCGMVLYHNSYVAEECARHKSETIKIASKMAQRVLDHFGLTDLSRYNDFMLKSGLFDRGEEVDVHDFLYTLKQL